MSGIDIVSTLMVRFITFYAIMFTGLFLTYLGRKVSSKNQLTWPWTFLFTGVLSIAILQLVGIAYLIGAISDTISLFLENIFSYLAGFLITLGISFIVVEKSLEANTLKEKEMEIREVLMNLREKFLKGQINEKDLEKLSVELLKDLSETEVKIKRINDR